MVRPPTVAEILLPLLAPLSYGARDGFAHLHTLRNLEPLVEAVAARLEGLGHAGPLPGRLRSLTRGFDAAADDRRREALGLLARELANHVELPETGGSVGSGAGARDIVPPPVPTGRKRAKRSGGPAGRRAKETVPDPVGPEPEAVPRPVPVRFEGLLATLVSEFHTVRGRLASSLRERGITRAGDVLFSFPRGYEDRRQIVPIARLEVGRVGVSVGEVQSVAEIPMGRRRVFRVVLGDGTGSIAATWYRYRSWFRQRFRPGARFVFSGEVRLFGGHREIAHPELEPADGLENDPVNFGRVVPLYPGFERAEQRAFRLLAHKAIDRFARSIEDPLPKAMLDRLSLPTLPEAVRQVHFPEDASLGEWLSHRAPAQRRLAFDELLLIQIGLSLRRQDVRAAPGIQFRVDEALRAEAVAALPFALTGAQARALEQILADMARPEPMNRLLQGDVGSGKTAIAVAAGIVAARNGYQVGILAPTEILAEQHFLTVASWLGPRGLRAELLTAGIARRRKDAIKGSIAAGEAHFVLGTHALLQDDVSFARLGLVVIDEQHRFGVLQRARFREKGTRPDVLVMTATPIPRTLAMTLYGDLDLSILDELPPGRTPVTTRVFGDSERSRAYALLARELERGRQAFVVYPLVEESEKVDLASATEGAQRVARMFPGQRVGLIHGRMKVEAKDETMRRFRAGELGVLVSTTVVEVGVDVPNATVMIVEAAERFGLSQLHQLRGRVGRGRERSTCFLISGAHRTDAATQRLDIMERTNDGFVIAEEDLVIRGPGEFLGTRQSGVPGLSVADLTRDQDLLLLARQEAARLAEEDPKLEAPEHALLRRTVGERWEGRLSLARIG